MAGGLFDFAVITIFAREFLEGSIIIGEYRTIILRGDSILEQGVTADDAFREITVSSLIATALALVVIAAIAIPLSILSHSFDDSTSKIIEGISKIVAGICLLQLSLKLPKFLGVYGSSKKSSSSSNVVVHDDDNNVVAEVTSDSSTTLTLRSIRFNVMWNIWREVAECGVFLIPFFLSGDGLEAVPLSAVTGSIVGTWMGVSIYYANKTLTNKVSLTVFVALILMFLSSGLFTGGCHNLEMELGSTKQIWNIKGKFWDVHRLPMTVLKPFGYNDSRTVLEICCYWGWLALGALLHYRKYRRVPILVNNKNDNGEPGEGISPKSKGIKDAPTDDLNTAEYGEATVDATTLSDPAY